MTDGTAIAAQFARRLAEAAGGEHPYRHWLIADVLPAPVAGAVTALPFAPPDIGDTKGKRETHNTTRIFFSAENRAAFPVCAGIAEAFAGRPVVTALEQRCGIALAGSFLRIEYCLDVDGFWLEPHTDIGAKLFTMLIYLSTGPGAEALGTDIMDAAGNPAATAPAAFNSGLIFVPGADTWHGFRRRPIAGVRRSLIVNYVKSEWRSRHELAFPDRPIG